MTRENTATPVILTKVRIQDTTHRPNRASTLPRPRRPSYAATAPHPETPVTRTLLLASLSMLPILAGCAAHRQGEKPVLTARAVARIAAQCGAVRSKFHPGRTGLPSADFTLRAGDDGDAESSPAVRCIGTALDAYRHAYFGFRPDTAPPPSS